MSAPVKIGIVIGSIREPRRADSVSEWVISGARDAGYPDVEFAVLDLKDFDLPPMRRYNQHSEDDAPDDLGRWRDEVNSCHGFLFITPEYNRAAPGYFKNAFDLLDVHWKDKPIGFVSYGGVGGARAVDAWRTSIAAYNMHSIGRQITLFSATDFESTTLIPHEHRDESLQKLLADLVGLTQALN